MSNPNPRKENGTSSPTEKQTYGKCGKKNCGDCLKVTDNCFGCGESGHKIRYFPNMRSKDKGSGQSQASDSNKTPNKNRFYSPHSTGEQETSPDVVIGMLKFFSIDVYALINQGTTLSFCNPLIAKKF